MDGAGIFLLFLIVRYQGLEKIRWPWVIVIWLYDSVLRSRGTS
jgi:hypothetical protein